MYDAGSSGGFGCETPFSLPLDGANRATRRQSNIQRALTDFVAPKSQDHAPRNRHVSYSVVLEGPGPLKNITPLRSRSLSALGSPVMLHDDSSYVNYLLSPFSTPKDATPSIKYTGSPLCSTPRPTASCGADTDQRPLNPTRNVLGHVGVICSGPEHSPFVDYREVSKFSWTTTSGDSPTSPSISKDLPKVEDCAELEDESGCRVQTENVDHSVLDEIHEDIKRLYGAFLIMIDQGLFDEPERKRCTERFSRFFSQPQGATKNDPAVTFQNVDSRNISSPPSSSDEETRSKFNSKFLSMLIEDLRLPLSESVDQRSAIDRLESQGDSARASRAEDGLTLRFAKTKSNSSRIISSTQCDFGFDFGGSKGGGSILTANKRGDTIDHQTSPYD